LGHRNKPESEIDWLLLAQHYGLPTQLLDWTENPFVAIFFALGEGGDGNRDGCLWALSPTVLNQLHENPFKKGRRGLRELDEPIVCAIAKKAFGMKEETIARQLFPGTNWDPQGIPLPKVLALAPQESDERILAQSGRFTIHHSDLPVEELDGHESFLRKYQIPAELKVDLKSRLEWFGIRKWNLFPDLQALAEGLRDQAFLE
jgi:hypothetical protein